VITLSGNVLFETGKSVLRSAARDQLGELADTLVKAKAESLTIEGFTDSTGSESHNQQLSERRAAAVATALAGQGVPRERIAMRAYGEAFPVASNDSAASRQQNRRVEIVLSNEGAAIPPRAAAR